MHQAVVAKDFDTAFEIWGRLGPLARYAWRAPIRDYRPRMKEVLVMQGLIRHAAVRPPQLPVDDAERAELRPAGGACRPDLSGRSKRSICGVGSLGHSLRRTRVRLTRPIARRLASGPF